MSKTENSSLGEKIGYGATMVYTVPVAIILGVVEAVALIPTLPYAYYLNSKEKRSSFENYRQGKLLLQAGNYHEARNCFLKAIEVGPALVQRSDIYYKIAETYDGEKQAELANKYYRMFLDYSISLFPDYFPKYDAQFKDDLNELTREFDSAEDKIAKSNYSEHGGGYQSDEAGLYRAGPLHGIRGACGFQQGDAERIRSEYGRNPVYLYGLALKMKIGHIRADWDACRCRTECGPIKVV